MEKILRSYALTMERNMSTIKRLHLNKVLLALLVLMVAIVGALLFVFLGSSSVTHSVVLTDDGYVPSSLTIKVGDKIRFESNRGEMHWPASNAHPSHLIYPEFDPLEPIKASGSWEFTFKKPGVWKFHDHLAPLYKGEVNVTDQNGETVATDCNSRENVALMQKCWQDMLAANLRSKGLDSTFELLAKIYETEPDFAPACHSSLHALGETGYAEFAAGREVKLTEKSAYCAFGFYHGFMEALLQDTGDPTIAQKFCESVRYELAGRASNAAGHCYHGIGHGMVDGEEERFTGSVEAIITKPLALCRSITDDERLVLRCATGVFNSLAIAYFDPRYGVSPNKEDPFDVCKMQTDKTYKTACYYEMNTLIMRLSDGDLLKSARYIDTLSEPEYDQYAVEAIASYAAYYDIYENTPLDYDGTAQFCLSLGGRKMPCIQGFVAGLLEHGKPGVEYREAFNFCEVERFSEEEKTFCFERLQGLASTMYTKEKSAEVCSLIDKRYKTTCSI
jgi:plastocyanin